MSSRKVYWKVNVTKESTDCCLRIILSQLFFVFFFSTDPRSGKSAKRPSPWHNSAGFTEQQNHWN